MRGQSPALSLSLSPSLCGLSVLIARLHMPASIDQGINVRIVRAAGTGML